MNKIVRLPPYSSDGDSRLDLENTFRESLSRSLEVSVRSPFVFRFWILQRYCLVTGPSPAGGGSGVGHRFQICAPSFHVWSPVAAYCIHCFLPAYCIHIIKCVSPCGFWPPCCEILATGLLSNTYAIQRLFLCCICRYETTKRSRKKARNSKNN